MKLFTISEANDLLNTVIPMLHSIRRVHLGIDAMRPASLLAAASSDFGGGAEGGTAYVTSLFSLNRLTTELNELGVELKDHRRGLIDFPTMRGERVVLLCWQFEDGDKIRWWHEMDGGFAGRQPL